MQGGSEFADELKDTTISWPFPLSEGRFGGHQFASSCPCQEAHAICAFGDLGKMPWGGTIK